LTVSRRIGHANVSDDAEHIRARVCRDGRGGSQGHRRCAQGL